VRVPKEAATPELARAEAATIRCLEARDFSSALRVVHGYESLQPVPRGIGVDWSKPPFPGEVPALAFIYADSASEMVRRAAAMCYLWGAARPRRRWLSAEAKADAYVTHLLIAACGVAQAANNEHARAKFGIVFPPRRP
jgi:hypothetical protein